MRIPAQNILNDYQTLRTAAAKGEKEGIYLEGTGHQAELVSSKIDNDPATNDTIVISAFSGAFSGPGSAPATITFNEVQQDGKQLLEFSAEQPNDIFDPTVQTSKAVIDIQSGFILSSTGSGNFVVGNAEPAVCPKPTGPSPDEQQATQIRNFYGEMQQMISSGQLKVGEEFFSESLSKSVTVTKSEAGYLEVNYWGGAPSGSNSGTFVETYRQYREDGKDMLAFSQTYSGDIFDGEGAGTKTRNISL